MIVKDLIEKLQRVKNQEATVKFFISWDDERDINGFSPEDFDGNVVLSDDLPFEKYAQDYKYER